MSLLKIACVTDRKAGSSVCEASSNMFFSEGVPSGMSIAVDVREVCLGC